MTNKKFKDEEVKDDKKDFKSNKKKKGPKDNRKIHRSRRYDHVSTDTATNSVDWYVTDAQMLADAASIPYFNALGNSTYLESRSKFLTNYNGATNITFNNTSRLDRSVPGICCLHYVPTIGKAEYNSDPINLAARNIYSFVRKANSGSKNYDAPNMMMYLMACDSVYTFYQWMLRVYGLLRKYSAYNQYYNEAILKALNVDAASFAGWISDFRAYINKYALKANSLCVPNTFTIYQRHMYLVSALFKDTSALKSQLYVFNPDCLYYYDEPNGKLKATLVGARTALIKPADIMTLGDTLLDSILTSEDMALIKGDILKAFGDNGIYSLSMMGEDYVTEEIHDYEVLTQIQAANFLGPIDFSLSGVLDIVEDTTIGSATEGALKQSVTSRMKFTSSGAILQVPTGNVATILNMYVDNPTAADTMVASRLAHYAVPYVQGDASAAYLYNTAVYYGSEVCTTFTIWTLDQNHVGQAFVVAGSSNFVNGLSGGVGNAVNQIQALFSAFEWHPVVHGVSGTITLAATPSLAVNYDGVLSLDWDNYTVCDSTVLSRMHECAMLGEFRIPQLGIMM